MITNGMLTLQVSLTIQIQIFTQNSRKFYLFAFPVRYPTLENSLQMTKTEPLITDLFVSSVEFFLITKFSNEIVEIGYFFSNNTGFPHHSEIQCKSMSYLYIFINTSPVWRTSCNNIYHRSKIYKKRKKEKVTRSVEYLFSLWHGRLYPRQNLRKDLHVGTKKWH